MSQAPFELALLDAAHDRTLFRNDLAPLERCLREQVTQDTCRRVASCFVALASGKKLPRYPSVPAVRMDRLAVAQTFKRKGLDSALLADALERAAGAETGAYAMVVDARGEAAAAFYRHHGFICLAGTPFADLPTTQP